MRPDFVVESLGEQMPRDADPKSAGVVRQAPGKRRNLLVRGGRITRIEPAQHVQRESRIGDRAAERTDLIERRGKGDEPVP